MTEPMDTFNPARYVRDTLFNRWNYTQKVLSDEEKQKFAEEEYLKVKQEVIQKIADGDPDYHMAYEGLLVALCVILLAFGRLDVVDDIFEYSPTNWEGGWVFYDIRLIPFPNDLESDEPQIQDSPASAKAWFQAHRDHLVWNEEQGRFLLTE